MTDLYANNIWTLLVVGLIALAFVGAVFRLLLELMEGGN